MTTILLTMIILGAAGLLWVLLWVVPPTMLGTFLKFRRQRQVICPENGEIVTIDVDAGYAARTAAMGKTDLRLKDCARWPQRQACAEDCLRALESELGCGEARCKVAKPNWDAI